MKKYVLAIAIASGALLSYSAVQAAPLSTLPSAVQEQVLADSAVQKVWHCRHWSGGWGCGRGWGWGHGRYRSHWRWGSRHRW
jgi:hypothetical protein